MSQKENTSKEGFLSSFKKKFEANKIVIESILFEGEKKKEEKKDRRYWYYFIGVYLLNILINYFHFLKNSDFSLNINDIRAYEYLKNYLTGNFIAIFKISILNNINFDMPLYYILHWFSMKVVGLSYLFSIFYVNSIITFFIGFGIFYLLLQTRNEKVAITAVCVFFSMPSFITLERHFSPVLLSSAFVLWSYYFYIKSEKLDDARNLHIFIVIYSLGLLSDKFFIVYTLPMLGFINILLTTVYWEYVVKVLFPFFIISAFLYIKFFMLLLFNLSLDDKLLIGINWEFYLKEMINFAGGVYFFPLIVFFVWMLVARFMVYEPRNIIFKWILYPFVVFSVMPFLNKEYIFPLMIPFVIGSVIMISPYIRKYFNYTALIIMLVNGFSIFNLRVSEGFYIIGMEKFNFRDDIEIIIKAIKNDSDVSMPEVFRSKDINVSVDVRNEYFNYNLLNYMRKKFGFENLKFMDSLLFVFSDYIISDYEINNIEFKKIYNFKNFYVYRKNYDFCIPNNCDEKCYIENIKLGDIYFDGIWLENVKIDDQIKIFKESLVKVNYINFKGIDIYSSYLKFKNLGLSCKKNDIKYLDSLEISNAKISNFSVSRFLEDNFKNIELSFFDNLIILRKKIYKFDFSYYISTYFKNDILFIKVNRFEINNIGIPFINYFAHFIFDLNKAHIPFHIKSIKITKDFTVLK